MKNLSSKIIVALLGMYICLPLAANVNAAMRVADIFGNNMVLQREKKIPVWGWAEAGEKITVVLAGQEQKTEADDKGQWKVEFAPLKAGGPFVMTVEGEKKKITRKNILIGEVWLASGQSNMQFTVNRANNAASETASANYPEIRHFGVIRAIADVPQNKLKGRWQVCSPKTVGNFTAVGYYFARHIHKKLSVPIGIIHASWGATPAESWATWQSLETNKALRRIIGYYKSKPKFIKTKKRGKRISFHKDPGNIGFDKGWAKPDFDDAKWKSMTLPHRWERVIRIDGAVWFRKTVYLPPSLAGKTLKLSLGIINDFDVTYFNGVEVGQTGKETARWRRKPRLYTVPEQLVKTSRAVLAVRVFDRGADGGLIKGKMELSAQGSKEAISLSGPWKYEIEVALDPRQIPSRYDPAGLYNGMIHPLVPYAIRGAIWYQGESNAARAYQYRTLFPVMIKSWRKAWGEDFPFGFVQLASYAAKKKEPCESTWAELREAQLMTLSLPNTGMATAIDIGDVTNVHPKNKQDVGKRLALWAMAKTYGKDIVYSGPLYKSMRIEGDTIRLQFDHLGGGLVSKSGNKLKGFAIAGQDRKFVWGQAVIDGDEIVVRCPEISNPVAIRYAWAYNPVCSLYNKEGLPALPFRTDQWKRSPAKAR